MQHSRGGFRAKTARYGGGPIVLGLEVADRPASQLEHLERADDPAAVVGMKAGGGLGVERGQPVVERRIAVLEGVALQPQAKVLVGAGPSNKPRSSAFK